MAGIFLSHSSHDKLFVQRLAIDLSTMVFRFGLIVGNWRPAMNSTDR